MGLSADPASRPLGIIAGAGRFPILLAREAKRQGRTVIAIGVRGWADPSLAEETDTYEELDVGALGTLLARLKSSGVRQVIMAGKVTKQVLLDAPSTFDAPARRLLDTLKGFSVNALLGQVGKRLAAEGITLLDSSTFLKPWLCPAGVLTTRAPSAAEEQDIRYGREVARTLASLDVGQTVVVKQRVVAAVEALEGTDAAIRRAHEVAGDGLVVVKWASPTQDMRFDLPVLGPESVGVFRQCGVSCAAVQAQKTLLLDQERLIRDANAQGLCLVGLTSSRSVRSSR